MKMSVPSWLRYGLRHIRDVAEEFIYLVIFSFMPVWLGGIFKVIHGDAFFSYLNRYFENGEALLICTATIDPSIFLMFKEFDKNSEGFSRPFPARKMLTAAIVLICLISAAIIGFRSAIDFHLSRAENVIWYISISVSVTTLLLWVFITEAKNIIENGAPGIMRQDTDDFLKEWK